jgi:hypothetical protein
MPVSISDSSWSTTEDGISQSLEAIIRVEWNVRVHAEQLAAADLGFGVRSKQNWA